MFSSRCDVQAKLQMYQDGSAHLSVLGLGEGKTLHIQTSGSYGAVISARKGNIYHEVSVSNAATSISRVITIISVEHEKATKRVLIEFPNNVTREDVYTVTPKDGTTRHTDWKYPTGTTIHAQYQKGERLLLVKKTKNEPCEVRFETKGSIVGKRLEAITRNVEGSTVPVAIWRRKVLSPAKTTSLLYNPGLGSNTTDNLSGSLVTNANDGTVSTTQIQGLGSNSISAFSTTLNGKGHQRHSTQHYDINASGGSSAVGGTIETEDNGDGTTTVTISQGKAYSYGNGNISSWSSSITTTYDAEGNIINQWGTASSWNVETTGVQTENDTLFNADGTIQSSTTVTQPDGSSNMINTGDISGSSFWNGGDETEGGSVGGGGEGNLGEGDLTGEDAGGSDNLGGIAAIVIVGADGRYPTEDGTDSTPTTAFSGAADRIFTEYLSKSDVYLGGKLPHPIPTTSLRTPEIQDDLDYGSLQSAIDKGSSSPSAPIWGVRVPVPLPADPDGLPIASVSVLQNLGAINSKISGIVAASRAASIISALS